MKRGNKINEINGEIKNLLIIGKVGSGKSTLANVLSGTKNFTTNLDAISDEGWLDEKKLIKSETFRFKKQEYRVIDTFGLTEIITSDKEEVQSEISEITEGFKEGLCQVLFVIDGKISREEQDIYHLLREVILKEKTKDLLTIIRTKFEEFENDESIKVDLERMKEQPILAEIIENCRGIIHVDNPSFRSRRKSASKLANQLRIYSRKLILSEFENLDNYQIEGLEEIGEKIVKYKARLEELRQFDWESEQENNQKLREKIIELENLTERLNKALEEQSKTEYNLSKIQFVMKEAQLAQARKKIDELNLRIGFLTTRKIDLEKQVSEKNNKISHLNKINLKAEQEQNCIIS